MKLKDVKKIDVKPQVSDTWTKLAIDFNHIICSFEVLPWFLCWLELQIIFLTCKEMDERTIEGTDWYGKYKLPESIDYIYFTYVSSSLFLRFKIVHYLIIWMLVASLQDFC